MQIVKKIEEKILERATVTLMPDDCSTYEMLWEAQGDGHEGFEEATMGV